MRLAIPILINCVLVLAVYMFDKRALSKRMSYMTKQIIIGVLFGGVSAFASSYGVPMLGTTVNVRDAAPLSAGLIFGAPAGIISGCIGGIYRWFSVFWGGGTDTRLACSIATVLAGIIAGILRKRMFDNKKPTWGYGVCIAIACEVVHMILIFITNMNNPAKAFELVKVATIPMIIGNAIAVGFAIVIISILSRDSFLWKKGGEKIANTFQRGLLACIAIAFIVTSIFTYVLQSRMVKNQTIEMFTAAMNDVETDVTEKSDVQLLEITQKIKEEYENATLGSDDEIREKLDELKANHNVVEINVIKADKVKFSTDRSNENYDMTVDDQPREFIEALQTKPYHVQKYSKRAIDGVWRKYAAILLSDGGFIQVGYDAEQFHNMINDLVFDVTKNRHVGTGGFVAVLDENLALVVDDDESMYSGADVSIIGIDPPQEMLNRDRATSLYEAEIVDANTGLSAKHLYVFKFVEGYCIIAAMPESEAVFMRDASLYTSIFMQVIIFATLFVFIYVLIKKVIINNLEKANNTLGKITQGDLNVTVDVRSSQEFSSLSDDINSTVFTLKRYIAEAAARIDRELEYAKQIQLSALPTNFPTDEEYSIYAEMIAAKEVGGDFYDFYKLNDSTVAILAADVSGKGIPAAMFMMTAKTIIKDLAESGMSVDEIFTRANEKLCENNESGMFVTAWMGILDVTTGKMQFANAGHNPPLLKRANGGFEYLKTRAGLVLAGMEGVRYRIGELTLSQGDRLFLYTDGVTEATNTENMLYGEGRLLSFMNRNSSADAVALLSALKSDIDEFVGEAPQFDDITMLMFDYKPEEGGANMTYQTFPAKVEVLSDVLGFVERTLESCECSMKAQTAICVAIEEVFVNVAHYAYGDGEGDMVLGISFDEESRNITFRMTDRGTPFDPLQKPDPDITLSAEEREIGGLGIFITKKTMDNVTYTYENGENVLTMIKKI